MSYFSTGKIVLAQVGSVLYVLKLKIMQNQTLLRVIVATCEVAGVRGIYFHHKSVAKLVDSN